MGAAWRAFHFMYASISAAYTSISRSVSPSAARSSGAPRAGAAPSRMRSTLSSSGESSRAGPRRRAACAAPSVTTPTDFFFVTMEPS
jgi:hypothetical protein